MSRRDRNHRFFCAHVAPIESALDDVCKFLSKHDYYHERHTAGQNLIRPVISL